jgi:peptidyl-prolyl cis-trans isomerase C
MSVETVRESEELTDREEVSTSDSETKLATRLRAKLPSSRKGKAILAAVLALVLAMGAGGYAWYRLTALPGNAAFRVGDQVVTVDELDHKVDTLRALYGVQPPADPAKLDAFRKDSAKADAVGIILDRAATGQGVVIADKTARDVLDKFVAQQLGDGPDARDKFVQALGSAGTTENAVLAEIKRQLAVNQLFDKVTSAPPISDAEASAAFPARRDQLGTPEKRQLGNIVVANEDEARRLVDDLRGGAPFDQLARQRSLDASTKDAGGALGEVAQSQLEPDYGKAAFTAPQGGVFGPVRNQFGWNVGIVNRVMAPVPAQFDQVKDALKNQLGTERATATWRAWLGDRIREAGVDYADAYRPADPDAVPPTGPAPGDQQPPR